MNESFQNRDRAATVWASLVEMYGGRLTRDLGESVPDSWRNSINSLRDFEIQRGLETLLESGEASAPSLPKFWKACKSPSDHGGAINQNTMVTYQDTRDQYEIRSDVWFFNWLRRECGAKTLDQLQTHHAEMNRVLRALLDEKKRVTDAFRDVAKEEGDVEPAEFLAALHKGWNRIAPVGCLWRSDGVPKSEAVA